MKINTGITIWLLVVVIATILVGLSMSYFVSGYFKDTILKRAIDVNAKFISLQAHQHLKAEDFTPNNFDSKEKTYTNFFHEIDTGEIVRIKVWSTDETVVYSDDKEIVGKSFHDNDELKEALKGETVAEVSNLKASENVSEKDFKNLIEIYIPIKSDANTVLGVIETYTSTDLINLYIENENRTIFLIAVIGIGVVCLTIILIFISFKKNIILPIIQIHEHAKQIKRGNLEVKSHQQGFDELKRLENEIEIMATTLKNQQEKIVEAERLSAIGGLTARLAHDMRNPLTIITNALALIKLKKATFDEQTQKYFDKADKATFRLVHQVNDVMDYVTPKPLNLQNTSLNTILKNSLERPDIPKDIIITLPENDLQFYCDPLKMEIVFVNLINNAIHAMNDTTKTGKIEISFNNEEEQVTIKVKDNGDGIPENVLNKIFNPLFTTKQVGTGLGLPSCKSIVEKHGGTIEVDTAVGIGTTFIIKLPKILKIINSNQVRL